ncbi:MAG: leucyl aminopeptidase, partial [Planctomycetales bacterium]
LYSNTIPAGAAAEVDQASEGLISRLLESDEIETDLLSVTPLLAAPGVAASQVVCVGLGPRAKLDAGAAYRAAAAVAKRLASKPRKKVAFYLDDLESGDITESAIAGSVVGCQGQDLYRREKKMHCFEQLLWTATEDDIRVGDAIGTGIRLTRRLVNEPPDRLYPAAFTAAAIEATKQLNLEVEVWGQQRLESERCGALLAVSRGSSREPQMVMMHYCGAGKEAPTLALVGKGVTFDSGGLSLKPSSSMLSMKCDMAGAATVLGAMHAIAALHLPVNISGYMGLVENMTGADAYKLGDVLTARDGTTIEIHNTDAEGRLVLADTLSVALDDQPDRIIDLATLTGACVVALGENTAGIMTNNQEWCDEVLEAASEAGEAVWQLPMFSEFAKQIKSQIADIKNTGDGRWGGAMTAAKLLEHFVGDVPWVHIDIAGPAYTEKPLSWLDAGGTGALVRTLIEVARDRSKLAVF